ncbi:MAG: hypothetical protein JWL62_3435 [Hyphomicrobiales bacterium]|nr:hypothetical protein [Hyphomicrobiales bacterium]
MTRTDRSNSRLTALDSALAGGGWLSLQRLTVYSAMLVGGYLTAFVVLIATRNGVLDTAGRPIATDFSMIWTAGRAVLAGHPEAPFSIARHGAMMRDFFGPDVGLTPWHYPPYFLPVAALLATLPYFWALAIWLGPTFGLYLVSVLAALGKRLAPRWQVALVAAASPAVFVNAGHGQNGFLTAFLFATGTLQLQRRPWLAGSLFALLSYKPQFMLVLPVALLAGRHWKAIAAGCMTWLAMTLALYAWLGASPWLAFFDSLPETRRLTLELGATGWEKIQTVFAAVRLIGGPIQLAYAVQVLTTAVVLIVLARLWTSAADPRLKGAALMIAALVSTPYSVDYDMVLLTPAIALAVSYALEKGFVPYEISLLALVWLTPLLARTVAGALSLPMGPAVEILFFAWIVRRSREQGAGIPVGPVPA